MVSATFKVIPPRTTRYSVKAPGFVLEQDNWNDYSFQTQYHLSFHSLTSSGEENVTLIGAVKILKRKQTKEDGILITADFETLGPEFCSVGQSLDYYERMRDLGDFGTFAMAALRDIIATPEIVEDFRTEPGWQKSLFRDQKDGGEQFRLLARGLVEGHYAKAPADQQSFTFAVRGWQSPIIVDTQSGEQWDFEPNKLPERVNVIVGKNGAGKSTLLARLARVAYGSPSERLEPPLSELGHLEPEGVGFPRVVTVAFSPFDSFKLPGSDDRNRLQIVKDMQRGVGRFVFIGLRDFAGEIDLPPETNEFPAARELTIIDDRQLRTKLKSIEQLNDEFLGYHEKIATKNRSALLESALSKLGSNLFVEDWPQIEKSRSTVESRAWFNQHSTGHKIALLIIFGLVANLESHSLVLLDEPETHLHPPLLAAMMHSLRFILKELESLSVIATHSPVVVQETMARHIHVVRREGGLTSVSPVNTETFGESIGLITSQIFGMESNATDYHNVLDKLIKKYRNIESIEALFKDGVMSHQARAYVIARLSSEDL